MKRKMTAALLGMMLLLTACGSKDASTVEDYGSEGTGTSQTKTEDTTTDASAGKGTEAGSTEEVKPRNGSSLIDQLGGENLTWQSDFKIGNTNAKLEVEYGVTDSTTLETYRLHSITKDRVYEKEVVDALFGDTATEVKREVSLGQGDSDNVVEVCTNYYAVSNPENLPDSVPAWVEEDNFTLHTYEGTYNGVTCQLSIAYDGVEGTKTLVLGPKSWGDVIGNPDLSEAAAIDEGEFFLKDPTTGEHAEKNTKDLQDQENHCTVSEEDAISRSRKFAEEQLHLKLPTDGVSARSYGAGSEDAGSRIIYYSKGSVAGSGLQGSVINGYALKINEQISNQNCYIGEFLPANSSLAKRNSGNIWFSGENVVGFFIFVQLDFEECLTEQAAILPFDRAMEVFQQAVEKDFDTTKLKGRDGVFRDAHMEYYPLQSPDSSEELTYIPVWVVYVYSGESDIVGDVVMNAMDGSIVTINYAE